MINGKEVWTDKLLPSLNPSAPDQIVGLVAEAGIPEAESAVKAARRAFDSWGRTPFEERRRCSSASPRFSIGAGSNFPQSKFLKLAKPGPKPTATSAKRWIFVSSMRTKCGCVGNPRLTQHVLGEESYQHYWPRGVALVIAPWNFPVAILCGMVTAALVTGNTVIMKPAEPSAILGALLMEIFEEAGVPPVF